MVVKSRICNWGRFSFHRRRRSDSESIESIRDKSFRRFRFLGFSFKVSSGQAFSCDHVCDDFLVRFDAIGETTSLVTPTVYSCYMAKATTSATDRIDRLGERIACKLDIPPMHVRYAHYRVHNGSQWTVEYAWERLVNGNWIEIDDRVWADFHGTPK